MSSLGHCFLLASYYDISMSPALVHVLKNCLHSLVHLWVFWNSPGLAQFSVRRHTGQAVRPLSPKHLPVGLCCGQAQAPSEGRGPPFLLVTLAEAKCRICKNGDGALHVH